MSLSLSQMALVIKMRQLIESVEVIRIPSISACPTCHRRRLERIGSDIAKDLKETYGYRDSRDVLQCQECNDIYFVLLRPLGNGRKRWEEFLAKKAFNEDVGKQERRTHKRLALVKPSKTEDEKIDEEENIGDAFESDVITEKVEEFLPDDSKKKETVGEGNEVKNSDAPTGLEQNV